MAYKPKYAAKGSSAPRREIPAPRTRQTDESDQERRPEVRRVPVSQKQSRGGRIVSILLGIVVIPASLVLTALLMNFLYTHVGRPKEAALNVDSGFTVAAAFLESGAQREAAALQALSATAATQATQPPTTEPPVVHLHYEIPADAVAAPKPDQSKFGESSDPKVLRKVLEDAAWLLDGQRMYFDPNGERYEAETQVRWFLDESMLAVTWKEVHEGSVYTFSEIKVQDPSQFRRHLAEGEYGSSMQFMTTEMAQTVNAVVASGGDFYRFRDFGAVVYQGVARRVEGTYAETCYIDSSGDMHFTYGGDVLTVDQVQAFVDEHDIQFSLAFGPILVDNGVPVEHTWYGVGEITEGYARAALCQLGPLHYIVMTANTQGAYQDIPTVETFQKYVVATGAANAYCLDGGQTASIVMNNQLINRPVYGEQRKISDIIYFATAVPEGG